MKEVHRTAYFVGKRKALNCPRCAKDGGLKRTKITRRNFLDIYVDKITDKRPSYCSNCGEAINVR